MLCYNKEHINKKAKGTDGQYIIAGRTAEHRIS